MQKITGVYCILSKVNNKYYIGSSNNINYRWNQHKRSLQRGIHINEQLQNDWNAYGESNFDFVILEECAEIDKNEKEQEYIRKYDSVNNGYNINNSYNSGGGARLDKIFRQHMKETPSFRHICYITKTQSNFIKKAAKNNRVKESEIFRVAIDLLIKTIKDNQ